MRAKKQPSTTDVTMREFRAAPAKILGRAARTGARLRVGKFMLNVVEAVSETDRPSLYGSMAGTGQVVGDPRGILSANDRWGSDG